MNHKHNGVERSNGTLRSHPIERTHKESGVKIHHNGVLTTRQKKYKQQISLIKQIKNKIIPKKKTTTRFEERQKMSAVCPIDTDGFVNIDLEKADKSIKGMRVKFVRKEGQLKRTVALEIDKM